MWLNWIMAIVSFICAIGVFTRAEKMRQLQEYDWAYVGYLITVFNIFAMCINLYVILNGG